ncbi:MAG TPA: hypothetical protein VFL13_06945 [Candidatus Baltobacteraceae bacterium]|nr:hypothetical protein [Candidatus Baltobacteraceae bacterium]
MIAALAVLATLTTLAYLAALWFIVRRQPQTFAGSRALNAGVVVLFLASRLFPENELLAMVASLAIAAALVAITRRSNLLGGVLAAAPLIAMLFTVDRTFFGDSVGAQFRDATVAALCVPGPFALTFWLISLSRRTRGYPKTSGS